MMAKSQRTLRPSVIATFICNLRYRSRNVDVRSAFTANTVLLRPPSLNSAVRTDGFSSLEWPLYEVLSILILLTVAILRSCPRQPFRTLVRDPALETTWFAFKPPHSRARSFRDSSSRLLSFSDFPTFPMWFDLPLAFFIDHAQISLAVPSISLRIHRSGYPGLWEGTCTEWSSARDRLDTAMLPSWRIGSENYSTTK